MDRNPALEFVRVTEAAALASARWMGRGDANAADDAAVKAMRQVFQVVDTNGTVVIGEGERDEAPMLYIGEKVGRGGNIDVDIALDPLECTNSVAYGRGNALSVLAAADKGNFLHAPDTYMEKIAVGPEAAEAVDLDLSVGENLERIAEAKGYDVENLTVVILERDRHKELIKKVRAAGARIKLILDGGENIMLAATGVTEGDLLKGVRYTATGAFTHSIVMRSKSGTIRFISTEHHFEKDPDYH